MSNEWMLTTVHKTLRCEWYKDGRNPLWWPRTRDAGRKANETCAKQASVRGREMFLSGKTGRAHRQDCTLNWVFKKEWQFSRGRDREHSMLSCRANMKRWEKAPWVYAALWFTHRLWGDAQDGSLGWNTKFTHATRCRYASLSMKVKIANLKTRIK